MPEKLTLAAQSDAGFEAHRKATRRNMFLVEMDKVVPWAERSSRSTLSGAWAVVVARRWDWGRMLRIHFLQQWHALSESVVEEAPYDSAAGCGVGIDLGREGAPDETTVCKFRHLLERHGLAAQLSTA